MNTRHQLDRRTVLRGAGVALSLPLLEVMSPRSARAAKAKDSNSAKRLVCLYHGVGVCNGQWYPKQTGAGFQLSPTLSPLAGVRDQMSVVSGLHHPQAPGGHPAQGSWLTGANCLAGSTISIDQAVAEAFGRETRFPSLQWKTASNNDAARSISWTRDGVALPAVSSPRAIFNRLFVPDDAASKEAARKGLIQKRSLLDLVLDEGKQLQRSLGKYDREKLDEYFFSVREVESMIQQSEQFIDRPKPRGDASMLEGDPSDPVQLRRMMYDLLFLALQTDSTRIVTWIVEGETAHTVYKHLGAKHNHHGYSHHGGDAGKLAIKAKIDKFNVSALARFLEKLQATKEGEHSLLDRTLVLHGSMLNNGGGLLNGGGSHGNKNLPTLLCGGKALGIKHGQHLLFEGNKVPLCNLLLTMLQAMGLERDAFGDATSTITGLI